MRRTSLLRHPQLIYIYINNTRFIRGVKRIEGNYFFLVNTSVNSDSRVGYHNEKDCGMRFPPILS